jgi:hypothetical protein
MVESPCQAEDQNGSDLELDDTIHGAYQPKFTNRSFLWWALHRDRVTTDPRKWDIIRFGDRLKLHQT